MSKFSRPVAFFLFVIMMANMCVWGFNATKLSHELKHIGVMEQAAADHDHDQDKSDAADVTPNEGDTFKKIEHHVMHAVDHIQFLSDVVLQNSVLVTATSIEPLHFPAQVLPLPALTLPFRPPRNTVLTA